MPLNGGPDCNRVARVAAADGDAAHTNFTILTANPEADLRDYTPGLVATPDMYKARSDSTHILCWLA